MYSILWSVISAFVVACDTVSRLAYSQYWYWKNKRDVLQVIYVEKLECAIDEYSIDKERAIDVAYARWERERERILVRYNRKVTKGEAKLRKVLGV